MWLRELLDKMRSSLLTVLKSSEPAMSQERQKLHDLNPAMFEKWSMLRDTSVKLETVLPNIHQYCSVMQMALESYSNSGQVILGPIRFEQMRVSVESFFLTDDRFYSDRVEAVKRFRSLALACLDTRDGLVNENVGEKGAAARTLTKLMVSVNSISDQLRNHVET